MAIDLTNRPEYLETFYAALQLGCVPVNVNFRYRPTSCTTCSTTPTHGCSCTGPSSRRRRRTPRGSSSASERPLLLEAGEPYERALTAAVPPAGWTPRTPSGDDLIFLYTGGTTGMPKGVMWRNDDLYVALWASSHPRAPEPPDPFAAARAGKRAATLLPAAPLMHGTGLFATLAALAGGGTVVLVDHQGLDPELVWDEVAREHVQTLTIVGDVFARPLLDALHAEPDRWDLSVAARDHVVGRALQPRGEARPARPPPRRDHPRLARRVGGHGPAPVGACRRRRASRRPSSPWTTASAWSTRNGARRGARYRRHRSGGHGRPDPARLLQGPEKSAATFRMLDGVRYSIPGDYATVEADGTVRLLGRGSACINTGGEKVYPEEVEAELRNHPRVFDCVVVGVPDERFGELVVAVVQVTDGDAPDEAEMVAWCRARMAGYKAPRRFLFVDSLPRSAAGKAHHGELRALAVDLLADDAALTGVATGAAQAPRASGAVQRSGAGGTTSMLRPELETRSRPVRLAS